MRMPVDQVPAVVAAFFDNVIVPAAQKQGGLLAFGSSFIGGMAVRNANAIAQQYLPLAKQFGVVDDANTIDIDMLYEEATKAMQKGKPTILGYTFDQSDVDRLRDIMNSHGV